MYSIDEPTARQISRAVSPTGAPSAAISPASAATSGGGVVAADRVDASTRVTVPRAASASSAQSSSLRGTGPGRTSTRLVAVTESSRCGVSTSKVDTRVPQ
jgi:hypothetical protein